MSKITEDTIITKTYHHIDNGGPTLTLETKVECDDRFPEDKTKTTHLNLNCNYYGYPSVSANFFLNGQDEIAILTALRNAIDEHIEKLK